MILTRYLLIIWLAFSLKRRENERSLNKAHTICTCFCIMHCTCRIGVMMLIQSQLKPQSNTPPVQTKEGKKGKKRKKERSLLIFTHHGSIPPQSNCKFSFQQRVLQSFCRTQLQNATRSHKRNCSLSTRWNQYKFLDVYLKISNVVQLLYTKHQLSKV